MLLPHFCGGLGNRMFQLASVYGMARDSGHKFGINPRITDGNAHTGSAYFDTLFAGWLDLFTEAEPSQSRIYREGQKAAIFNWRRELPAPETTALLTGYYQHETYFRAHRDDIFARFNWGTDEHLTALTTKYHHLDNAIFLHVRRGDYLHPNHQWLHYIPLEKYYKKCLKSVKKQLHGEPMPHIYVFTNDIPYCKTAEFLQGHEFTVVDENEIDSLYLMSRCSEGGIAANSSFSWWGLYLNPKRKHLFLPAKWFTDPEFNTSGLYFKECTKISVD